MKQKRFSVKMQNVTCDANFPKVFDVDATSAKKSSSEYENNAPSVPNLTLQWGLAVGGK